MKKAVEFRLIGQAMTRQAVKRKLLERKVQADIKRTKEFLDTKLLADLVSACGTRRYR